jgi:phosphoribosylformylglycinamidine synthase
MGQQVQYVWHKDTSLEKLDCMVLPGGFSYGDYLRAGAIARFSPIMQEIKRFAARGGLVIGICNGFQILLETGLLPGAMHRNNDLHFICRYLHVRVENPDTPFTHRCSPGQVLRIPVAHMDGNYHASTEDLEQLEESGQVVLRYCSPEGNVDEASNPNGSVHSIAGICNRAGNVFGLMPHPERCTESLLGSVDGRLVWESLCSKA